MGIANSYPVFEADQVLTNNHLNELLNYLDQQDRLTRSKLIGSGIVCGLEIKTGSNSLTVSKGCAITSQGYMVIPKGEVKNNCHIVYTHYVPYTAPARPDHIHFIQQCEKDIPFAVPFYREFSSNAGLLRLLSEKELHAEFEANDGVRPISPAVLADHIVVLFLEAEELNLKNCDTNDCNDKGSRMDFDVKALLVHRKIMDAIISQDKRPAPVPGKAPLPLLKRYNIPSQPLTSSSAVLQAFRNIVSDTLLDEIGTALQYSTAQYGYLLENVPATIFNDAATRLKEQMKKAISLNPAFIQYIYDYIDDLIKAWHEFTAKAAHISSECCMEEMKFPLHIMLGEADKNTTAASSLYRQHFIYSPLFYSQKESLAELRSLFTRLRLMIDQFNITNIEVSPKKMPVVKITPSRHGTAYLSKRCIPYYYNVGSKSLLHYFWSYEKTKKGNEKWNHSYNAANYGAPSHIISPLPFDIEAYDFFRIEGHIGKHINEALPEVKELQQNHNLPFEVIALSADYIGALVKGEEPQCVIQDLESDYRVLIAEFICMLHDVYCKAAQTKYDPSVPLKPFVAVINNPGIGIRTTARERAAAITENSFPAGIALSVLRPEEEEEEKKMLASVPQFRAEVLEKPFIASIITESHFLKIYRKGDTLRKLCKPGAKTVGSAYLSMMAATRPQFINPVAINKTLMGTFLLNGFFELIDRVESLFEMLMNNELAELDIRKFKTAYDQYETTVKNMSDRLVRLGINPMVFLNTCFAEKLEALKSEYNRRTAQYKLAKNFSQYFSQHGGVEHKAGVPKGGTFILVYHEERKGRIPLKETIFSNKAIAGLVLKQAPGLLEKATSATELELKTQDLQLALSAKSPELSFQLMNITDKFTEDCNTLTAIQKRNLKAMARVQIANPGLKITDGIVIADFYIPYICCSDCPPVSYVLPIRTVTPSISIEKTEFCNKDKNKYEITVQPLGGKLTIGTEEIKPADDGAYYFEPAKREPKEKYELAYTIADKTAKVNIRVAAAFTIEFVEPRTNDPQPQDVRFRIKVTPAARGLVFVWNFGDGSSIITGAETTVPHSFPALGNTQAYLVKVAVKDSPCEGAGKTVTIKAAIG
ncbi:MAG: PKD domain-containing protein [Chitinophagaceae bacterium]|nr:PKD domain-containing protein [Chitinophagaceae bacterium]